MVKKERGQNSTSIPGYDYGKAAVARSPVSMEELRQIEASAGWSDEDAKVLQHYSGVFRAQAEHMVDAWRAFIGAQPHLAQWFFAPDGRPDDAYKARVKARFVQWVIDAISRPRDQPWIDYQEEIGLREEEPDRWRTHPTSCPAPLRACVCHDRHNGIAKILCGSWHLGGRATKARRCVG